MGIDIEKLKRMTNDAIEAKRQLRLTMIEAIRSVCDPKKIAEQLLEKLNIDAIKQAKEGYTFAVSQIKLYDEGASPTYDFYEHGDKNLLRHEYDYSGLFAGLSTSFNIVELSEVMKLCVSEYVTDKNIIVNLRYIYYPRNEELDEYDFLQYDHRDEFGDLIERSSKVIILCLDLYWN